MESIGKYELDDNGPGHGDYIDICVSVEIPTSICRELTNAVSFYSKFSDTKTILNGLDYKKYIEVDFECVLSIFHDAGYIMDTFGGPLKPE